MLLQKGQYIPQPSYINLSLGCRSFKSWMFYTWN